MLRLTSTQGTPFFERFATVVRCNQWLLFHLACFKSSTRYQEGTFITAVKKGFQERFRFIDWKHKHAPRMKQAVLIMLTLYSNSRAPHFRHSATLPLPRAARPSGQATKDVVMVCSVIDPGSEGHCIDSS